MAVSAVSEGGHGEARRNAFVLAAAQSFGGGLPAIGIALGGLTGSYLLGPDKSLATLPVSTMLVGTAIGAIPAAAIMQRAGRRTGFLVGAVIGMIGGIVSGLSILAGLFVGFTIGTLIVGLSTAFTQQYRFAAADEGDEKFRARAISWVLAGGVVAAIVGPQTAIITRDLLAPTPFAGAFFGQSILALVTFLILSFLVGAARKPMPREEGGGRPLSEIAAQPRFIVAVVCGMGAFALMSLLMTAAPLAMVNSGHSHANAALGIQWHVIAMFAPSFITGSLIARFGVETVLAVGFLLLALCAAIALTGVDLMTFWLALILLGLGWNFGFIGATAMLTGTYRPEEKNRVQGINDFFVFSSVALSSLLSGRLLVTIGWNWINIVAFPIILFCLAAVVFAFVLRRRSAA